MPLGPVFHAELITTARRGRYYFVRVLYGLVLLLVIWSGYHALEVSVLLQGNRDLSISELTAFARSTFAGFVTVQVYAVLLLTPALVAPVIASEKSRKTFHYLLASQLSSAEIVLGKLGARLLMLAVILAVGLPVFSLLSLFGGIEPVEVVRSYGMLGGLLLFMAGQSILVSTLTDQPRRAIFHAYVVPAAVVIVPWSIVFLFRFRWPNAVDDLMGSLSYVWPLPRGPMPYGGLPEFPASSRTNGWMARAPYGGELLRVSIVWAAWGVAFIVAANLLLRPLGRRVERRGRVRLALDPRGRAHWRVIPRPACGDDPMIWKERHTARSGGLARMVGMFVHMFVLVLVGTICFELARDAFSELWAYGYARNGAIQPSSREQFGSAARSIGAAVLALWMLGSAAVAAGSITSEREGDTWVSLLSTPLTARQIVRAKIVGSILRFRWLGIMLVAVWCLSTLAGGTHLIGLLLGLVELPIFLGFAAALGVFTSLESKTTTRALALTLGLLALLNGGYLIFSWNGPRSDSTVLLAGVSPFLLHASLVSCGEFLPGGRSEFFEGLPAIAIGLPLYLISGLAMASLAISRFDALSDRPKTPDEPASERTASDLPASEQRKRWAT